MAKKLINGLPVFEARMTSENCGVLRVSLVDNPAIESDFVAYAEQERRDLFTITDEEKQRVFGPVLRADYPIYRRDSENGEYYIVFRADEIRAFAQKYLKDGLQNEVDLDHDFKSIEGAEMVQYFIKDTEKGIAPVGYDDVADGSLFAEYQITDADLWERIKKGEFHGFSVEIIHAVLPAEFSQIKQNMRKSVLAKVKEALAQIVAEAENAEVVDGYKVISTDKGIVAWNGEEDIKEGVDVWLEDEDGNMSPLEDGDYKTGDNRVITVKDGKVAEVKDAPVEEEKPAEEDAPANEPEKPAENAEEAPAPEEAPAAPTEEEKPADDVQALKDRIAELEAAVEAKDAEIADLKAKLEAPAGESAHDAYKKAKKGTYAGENPIADAMAFLK